MDTYFGSLLHTKSTGNHFFCLGYLLLLESVSMESSIQKICMCKH